MNYMGDNKERRSYYHNTDMIFMYWNDDQNGWIPDGDMMLEIRRGGVRIYRPYEDLFVTIQTETGHRIEWPAMQYEEIPFIRLLMEYPWCQPHQIYDWTVIPYDAIPDFEKWIKTGVSAYAAHWEQILRPMLWYSNADSPLRYTIPAVPVGLN